MINWLTLGIVILFGVAAVEFALRRTRNNDTTISFQPLWMQRFLLMIIFAGAAFTVEMVRYALEQPSVHRVWYILFAATVPFTSILVYSLNDIAHANKQMKRVNPGTESVMSFLPGKMAYVSGGVGAVLGLIALVQVPKYALAHTGALEIVYMAAGLVTAHLYLATITYLEFKYARRALRAARGEAGNGNSRISDKHNGARS